MPPDIHRGRTVFDHFKESGDSGWVILGVTLLLIALFITQLVRRRTTGTLLGYFAVSWLPLVAGICGSAATFIFVLRRGWRDPGVGDMAFSENLAECFVPLVMGSAVTFLALGSAAFLAFLGVVRAREESQAH
jgi:hypothetical protein